MKCPEESLVPVELLHLSEIGRNSITREKYAEAVRLYASSGLSVRQIAGRCGVTPSGLSAYICRHHRALLFARYGIDPQNQSGSGFRVRYPRGQSPGTHRKYREAIEACGDISYIEYNVSQIAEMFGLSGPALASQLRVHYPDVIPDRERMRGRLGIGDNIPRGARRISRETYREALLMYRSTDLSIPEVARRCNVSASGFGQFMRFYHHDVISGKARRRSEARRGYGRREPGALSANGRPYGPRAETSALYSAALDMYRATDKTIGQIASETGVSAGGFAAYLRQWHRGEILLRRGGGWDGGPVPDLRGVRQYRSRARLKYREAIESLRGNPRPVAEVAAEFSLNAEVFRLYLRHHEPELADGQGMMRLPGGRTVKRSSFEKYRPALAEYCSSSGSLKDIAGRHGIAYTSLAGFITRNFPGGKESLRRMLEMTGGASGQGSDE